MGVQASCPSSDLEQPGSDGGVQQVPKLVVDRLPEMNDYGVQVSREERTPGELHALVEMAKRVVKTIVTGREGTYP